MFSTNAGSLSVSMNALPGQSARTSSTAPASGRLDHQRGRQVQDRRQHGARRRAPGHRSPAGRWGRPAADRRTAARPPAGDAPDAVEHGVVRVRQRREEPAAPASASSAPKRSNGGRYSAYRPTASGTADGQRSCERLEPRVLRAAPDTVTAAVIAHSSAAAGISAASADLGTARVRSRGPPRLRPYASAKCSGERLGLQRVELGLRDRAAVEQLLRLRDLARGPAAGGDRLHVVVELRLLACARATWRSPMPWPLAIR